MGGKTTPIRNLLDGVPHHAQPDAGRSYRIDDEFGFFSIDLYV